MTRHNRTFDLLSIARKVMLENGFEVGAPAPIEGQLGVLAPDTGVVDERSLLWSSIDNRQSRDLDQVEVAVALEGGAIRLKIGIADVDALVPRGSPMDAYAALNTTSVYTGIAVFPMLDERLSNDSTSLLADADRRAVVTEFVVHPDGSLSGERIYRALVKNHEKLAYEDVGAWLEEGRALEQAPEGSELAAQLRLQDEAAERLRKRRHEQGALELETIEARPVAKDGDIVDLEVTRKNRARDLIEDLMIAANGVSARFLEAHGLPSLNRLVKTPRRWERIVALAHGFGAALPAEPDGRALSAFLAERKKADPQGFADVSLSVVKLLGPGEYAVSVPGGAHEGHFGLAATDYTHSTAPNRRFADLVTQRLLKAALVQHPSPYAAADLEAIAERCTQKENDARKVERVMRKVAAALFLSERVGETFDAVVTGAADKGTFVRLLHPPAEGRVVSGEKGLDVGDRVRVRLVATDPTRGYIDFAA